MTKLYGRIPEKGIKMGNMTIKDIAKKCGVGVSTVSRAMNNHPDINPKTKELIMKTIEEFNYVPNNSARKFKKEYSQKPLLYW